MKGVMYRDEPVIFFGHQTQHTESMVDEVFGPEPQVCGPPAPKPRRHYESYFYYRGRMQPVRFKIDIGFRGEVVEDPRLRVYRGAYDQRMDDKWASRVCSPLIIKV